MAQILTVQAQAQPRGSIHQDIQHFLAIAAAGQGFVCASGPVEGFDQKGNATGSGQAAGIR
jgi:hypothetical protein